MVVFKINFLQKIFQEHYESVNGLDPDQDRCSVSPDLVPNCLQRLSADDRTFHLNQFDLVGIFFNFIQNLIEHSLSKQWRP